MNAEKRHLVRPTAEAGPLSDPFSSIGCSESLAAGEVRDDL